MRDERGRDKLIAGWPNRAAVGAAALLEGDQL